MRPYEPNANPVGGFAGSAGGGGAGSGGGAGGGGAGGSFCSVCSAGGGCAEAGAAAGAAAATSAAAIAARRRKTCTGPRYTKFARLGSMCSQRKSFASAPRRVSPGIAMQKLFVTVGG